MGGAVRAANLRRRLSFPTVCAPHALVNTRCALPPKCDARLSLSPDGDFCQGLGAKLSRLELISAAIILEGSECLHCMCQQQVPGRGEIPVRALRSSVIVAAMASLLLLTAAAEAARRCRCPVRRACGCAEQSARIALPSGGVPTLAPPRPPSRVVGEAPSVSPGRLGTVYVSIEVESAAANSPGK